MATPVIFLALFAASSAVPTRHEPFVCSTKCSSQSQKFDYHPDTTYIYDYEVDTETSMAGASEETAILSIKARAEIESVSPCEFILNLKDVKVYHSDGNSGTRLADRSEELREKLERFPTPFSFDDGVISGLCPVDGENVWALNFKKGLLSAFQNSMEDFEKKSQKVQEVDVAGTCEAEYNASVSTWGWSKSTNVKKAKNLLACTDRDNHKSILQSVPYQVPSEIQSLPILTTSHTCEYVIDSYNLLSSALCIETHLFVPFSKHQSGVKTKVVQKLTYYDQRSGVRPAKEKYGAQRSLLFEHGHKVTDPDIKSKEAIKMMTELCSQTADDIRPETPRLFSELVSVVKAMEYSELRKIYNIIPKLKVCAENERGRKFFHDALPMAGTTGAVRLMVDILKTKEVSGLLAKAWLSSLAFIQEPTEDMIDHLIDLLDGETFEDAKLPVSVIVNTYCKTRDCVDSKIQKIVIRLASHIGQRCSAEGSNTLDKVLLSIRALGNLGKSGDTSRILNRCLISTSAPLEAKVAAADAFRRLHCTNREVSELWSTLRDTGFDTELRITAYLALMRCPNQAILNEVATFLGEVQDEQLGSYIYSHLKNLEESSDPHKQDVAKAVKRLSLKEFNPSLMSFSKNFESSVLISKLNMGFVVDADNIITTKSSPFPRSARLNITTELFGRAVNLLEIGGRVEGLDYLVQPLFEAFGFKEKPAKGETTPEARASLYARVFGNEIVYHRTSGIRPLLDKARNIDFLKLSIDLSKKQTASYSHSQKIIDFTVTVPTLAGIPLKINVNGTASIDIHAEGKADFRKVSAKPRSLEIDGEIKSSAAVEVLGSMTMDASVAQLGLSMQNTMHSSTGLKGRILVNRGRELDVEIDAPKDKMEIFQAKSQFFIKHNDVLKEQKMIKDNYRTRKLCTGELLAKITGTELCSELMYPNATLVDDAPFFPFTGPTSFSLLLQKKDTHKKYKLFAKFAETKKSSLLQFLMNTPGSKVNRLISADLTFGNSPHKSFDMILISPWKKINVDSSIVSNRELKSLTGTVLLDDKDKYSLKADLKIGKKKNLVVYTPFIEVTNLDTTTTLLSGQVDTVTYKSFDANVQVRPLAKDLYTVKALLLNIEKEKRAKVSINGEGQKEYVINVGSEISTNKKNNYFDVKPLIEIKTPTKDILSVQGSASYRGKSTKGDLTINVLKMKPASFSFKTKSLGRFPIVRYDVDCRLKSALVLGSIDSTSIKKGSALTSKVKMTYNIPKWYRNTYNWNVKVTDRSKNWFKMYTLKSNLINKNNPDYNIGVQVGIDHKKKHTKGDLEIKYGADFKNKEKIINLQAILDKKIKNTQNVDLKLGLTAKVPEKNVDISLRFSHIHLPKDLTSSVTLRMKPLLKDDIAATVILKDKTKKLMNYEGSGSLNIFGKNYKGGTTLIQKSAKQFAHSVNIVNSKNDKYSMDTALKKPGKNLIEFNSEMNLSGFEVIKVVSKLSLDPHNFQASGNLTHGKDLYGLGFRSKKANYPAGRLDASLTYPGRQIVYNMEVTNSKDKYNGKASINWDASKKLSRNSKISVDGSLRHTKTDDSNLINVEGSLQTPFKNFQYFSSGLKFTDDPSQYSLNGRVSWARKNNKISSNILIKKPLTLTNIQITFDTVTPFRKYKELGFEIDHRIEVASILSLLKGKVDNDDAEFLLRGADTSYVGNTEYTGVISLKTPFKPLSDLSLTLTRQILGQGERGTTSASLTFNSKKYDANLQMTPAFGTTAADLSGKLSLTWPEDKLLASWKHTNNGFKNVKTSLDTSWSSNKRLYIVFEGINNNNIYGKTLKGQLTVKSPWEKYSDLSLIFNHERPDERRLSIALTAAKNGQETIHGGISTMKTNEGHDIKFKMFTPLYKEIIRGEGSLSYAEYPITARTWLRWSPQSILRLDASVNTPSIENMEFDMKLTTPFVKYENINVRGSHKYDSFEYISHGNIAYGVKKMIDMETRLRYEGSVKLFRTKLVTPFKMLAKLDTGFQIDMNPTGFKGKADLVMKPLLKKYNAIMHYSLDKRGDIDSKIRLNTPLKEFRFITLSATRKLLRDGRRSVFINLERPRKVMYSFETTYKLQRIEDIKVDFNIKTPHKGYDSFGGSFLMYLPNSSTLSSKLNLFLPSSDDKPKTRGRRIRPMKKERAVESELNVSWGYNFAGQFSVKTPFERFGYTNALLRHEGDINGFRSNAEIFIDDKNYQGDIHFEKLGTMVKKGWIIVKSDDKDFKTVQLNMIVRNIAGNIKVETSAGLGDNTFKMSFVNGMTNDLIVVPHNKEITLSLKSPHIKDSSISFGYKDSSDIMRKKFDFQLSGNYGTDHVSSKTFVSFVDLSDVQFKLTLSSPLAELKSLTLDLVHHVVLGVGSSNLTLHYDNALRRDIPNFPRFIRVNHVTKKVFEGWEKTVTVHYNSEIVAEIITKKTGRRGDPLRHGGNTDVIAPNSAYEIDWKLKLFQNIDSEGKFLFCTHFLRDYVEGVQIDGLKMEFKNNFINTKSGKKATYLLSFHKDGSIFDLRDFLYKLDAIINNRHYSAGLKFIDNEGILQSSGHMTYVNSDIEAHKLGFDYEISGGEEQYLNTFNIFRNGDDVTGKVIFYKFENERMEVVGELKTPFKGYKYTKVEYRHDGTPDVRMSSMISAEYGDNKKASADFMLNFKPRRSLNLNVKTPYTGYNDMTLSGDLEGSRLNGKLMITESYIFTLTGVSDSSVYPYHPMFKVTTPLKEFKQLIINANGKPLDGVVDLIVELENTKIEGNAALKWERLFKMTVETSLKAGDLFEPIHFTLKNNENEDDKKMINLVAEYGSRKATFEGTYMMKVEDWQSNKETRQVTMDLNVPLESVFFIFAYLEESMPYNINIVLDHTMDSDAHEGKILFTANKEKLLDMQGTLNMDTKKNIRVFFREPWRMEYSAAIDDATGQYDIVMDWDRKNSNKRLAVKTTLHDSIKKRRFNIFNLSEKKGFSILVTHGGGQQSRTFGITQNTEATPVHLTSAGRVFWGDSPQTLTAITYEMTADDKSHGRLQAYEAEFKLGLPTRTLGLASSVSDDKVTKKAESTFSWDMADKSKKIGLRTSLTGTDYTKAGVTLQLPAEFQVTSEVTLNQGSTIFDGKTDISYSSDTRKTITFFQRVKNLPSHRGRLFSDGRPGTYNYSVEIGMAHPETKTDVTFDTHLGMNEESLTSSLGLKYLNHRRQMKNLALWTEIDKIKKQMKFMAIGPIKSWQITGNIIREDPLFAKFEINDGREPMLATIVIGKPQNSMQISIGKKNRMWMLKLNGIYTDTEKLDEIKAILFHTFLDDYAKIKVHLSTPKIVQTSLHWTPDMWTKARDWLTESIQDQYDLSKKELRQLIQEIKVEMFEKHGAITEAIADDSQPMIQLVEDELYKISEEMESMVTKVKMMIKRNEFYLTDIIRLVSEASGRYINVGEIMTQIKDDYKVGFRNFLQSVNQRIEHIKNYPLTAVIIQHMDETQAMIFLKLDALVESTIEHVTKVDEKFLKLQGKLLEVYDNLYKHPQMQLLRDRMNELRNIDYNIYMEKALEGYLPWWYDSRIVPLNKVIMYMPSVVYSRIPEHIRKPYEELRNEILHNVRFAYENWKVEEHLKEKTQMMLKLVHELIEDEVEEYLTLMNYSPMCVSVFDPAQGHIEADLVLPVEIKSLEELPDLSPLIKRFTRVSNYITEYVRLYSSDWNKISNYTNALWVERIEPNVPVTRDSYHVLRDLERVPLRTRHQYQGSSHGDYYRHREVTRRKPAININRNSNLNVYHYSNVNSNVNQNPAYDRRRYRQTRTEVAYSNANRNPANDRHRYSQTRTEVAYKVA